MSDPVSVAVIAALQSVVLLIVGALLNGKIKRVGKDAKAARVQVENGHTTNLREEGDERHEQNAGKLDTILEEIHLLRGSVRRLWRRSDEHTDQINDLEQTQDPRSRFEPRGKHRGDQT